jgi:hypothetical protein
MNIATLRVEGPDHSLDELKNVLPLMIKAQWRTGDIRSNGKVHSSSGVYATLADAENPGILISLIRSFLEQCKEKDIVFSRLNLTAELDIGFTVGDSIQFVASVDFSPSELLMCAECGIALCITAYPTSDEANAEDDKQEDGGEGK